VFPSKAQIALAAILLTLAGCRARSPDPARDAEAADAGYVSPPTILAAAPGRAGVALRGQAPAGAKVRLRTPDGQAAFAVADAAGRWSLTLARAPAPRIFGLSIQDGPRQVQADGYVLVGPAGQTALLRAGTGALRLDRPKTSGIAAVDFDAAGGALLSGWAPAGTDVAVRLDDRSPIEVRSDDGGRFILQLPRLSAGPHKLEVSGAGFVDSMALAASPAAPLAAGPLRSQLIGRGLRADWLTPGGGVQSTILAG
jgi:hypothetical protein